MKGGKISHKTHVPSLKASQTIIFMGQDKRAARMRRHYFFAHTSHDGSWSVSFIPTMPTVDMLHCVKGTADDFFHFLSSQLTSECDDLLDGIHKDSYII